MILKNIFTNKISVFGIVLLVKICMFMLFAGQDEKHDRIGYIFLDSPDRNEYLTPIDNLIENGNYVTGLNSSPYAGRLPGFVFPYIIFKAIFSTQTAIFLLGVFILLFSVLAAVKLFELIIAFSYSVKLAWLGLICIQFIPYYWHWDWSIHPNSLAASCLILAICLMYKYMQQKKNKHLLWSGFYIMWMFMLRGVTILVIPAIIIFLIYYWRTNSIPLSRATFLALVFLIPLLLVELIWVSRNFISLHKFIPLQTYFIPGANNSKTEYAYGNNTKYSMMKVRELISCWGGDNFWYFKGADMAWIVSGDIKTRADQQFKKIVFEGDLTPEKMEGLKQDIIYSMKSGLTQSQHDSIEAKIEKSSETYINEFKKHHKTYYYVVAPINRVKNFLIKNTTQDWPGPSFSDSGVLGKLLKALSAGIYFLLLLLIALVPIFKWRNFIRDKFLLLLFIFPCCLIFTFGFLINAAHYCYFIYGYIPSIIFLLYIFKNSNLKLRKVS